MSTKVVSIGLKDVHYAVLTDDDPDLGVATYDSPESIIGAITANINPNPSMETLFADDGPSEVATTIGQIELELSATGLNMAVQAVLLGHTISGGIMERNSEDVPPWVAVGFRSLKSTGGYRYIWLLKGKFSVPEQSIETKGDSINFQPLTIRGNFVKRDCDDLWMREADSDDENAPEGVAAGWFTDPDWTAGGGEPE
jgi:phi13 family phage major tail protein